MRDDIGERRDLAASEPERVAELKGLIDGFLADSGAVVPRPNPDYKDGLVPFPTGPVSKIVES